MLGPLHVLNDDLVQPKNGFGFHPHNNQEIFSYILEGYLTHQDNKKNEESLGRGSVQYMSAGTGVYHSEMNNNDTDICRFLQIWIYPKKNGLNVQYGSMKIDKSKRHNKLLRILSGTQTPSNEKSKISLEQDVNVFVSELDYQKSVTYTLKKNRNIYFVCAEGECSINDNITMNTRDAVRIYGNNDNDINLEIKGIYDNSNDKREWYPSCHFLFIEMSNKPTNDYIKNLRQW